MNKTNEVPERSAIPNEAKWDLEAIYENFDEWRKTFGDVKNKIGKLKNYSGKLGEGSKTLLNLL